MTVNQSREEAESGLTAIINCILTVEPKVKVKGLLDTCQTSQIRDTIGNTSPSRHTFLSIFIELDLSTRPSPAR